MARIAVVFLAAACLLAPRIACAADLPMKARPVVPATPAYTWTGFYIGGHVGALWTRQDVEWDPLPLGNRLGIDFGVNPTVGRLSTAASLVGGVHGGYNWQFAPAWLLGIEADSSWTSASSSANSIWTLFGTTQPVANSLTTMSNRLDWLSSVRGRIGYLVLPNALIYLTGGGAWGRYDYSASAFNGVLLQNGGYLATTSFARTETGYVLGGGLEWALTRNWLIRSEYLYYRLGGANSVAFSPNLPTTFPSSFTWRDPTVHVARLGLSYRFDWGVPLVAKY
ncbi:MAG: porin family protein [Bradyrhizobium sp.]|uniref:outer membrane protein n=1 Tax=Bradyrhizobium sp. TaxID=376 RepID=UPI001D81DBF9|nr:outer membrane beta-barrel protein [Bradyrhizobium sp.]MBV9562830.1 porin family protein [Bradyrhizobium sp.]